MILFSVTRIFLDSDRCNICHLHQGRLPHSACPSSASGKVPVVHGESLERTYLPRRFLKWQLAATWPDLYVGQARLFLKMSQLFCRSDPSSCMKTITACLHNKSSKQCLKLRGIECSKFVCFLRAAVYEYCVLCLTLFALIFVSIFEPEN